MNWLKRLLGRRESVQTEQSSDVPEKTDLHRVLLDFVQADDLTTCRQIMDAHPELLSQEANRVLQQLEDIRSLMSAPAATRFDERRALLEECQERGVEAAFSEQTRLTKPEKPPLTPSPSVEPDPISPLPEQSSAQDDESAEGLSEMLAQIRRENPTAADELDRALATLMGGSPSGSRSLRETTEVTCSHCQYSYHDDLWVVVDAQEHPELAAQCRDGSIHDLTCPECGSTFRPDVPLMYHDGEAQQLILAVQHRTTSEQDREVNRRLIGHLMPRIPGFMGLDYLNRTRTIPGVRGLQMLLSGHDPAQMLRETLGSLLGDTESSDANAEDRLAGLAQALRGPTPEIGLVETIQAFVEARSWIASRRVVEEHPELLSDEADQALVQMITVGQLVDEDSTSVLEEHRTLLQRCREIGTGPAFAEKMGLPPALAQLADLGDADITTPEAFAEAMARRLTQQDSPADSLMEMLRQAAGDDPDAAPLLDKLRRTQALQAALIAGSPANFARILKEHPELREPETLEILDELIEGAQGMGQHQQADRMARFKELLSNPALDQMAEITAGLSSDLMTSLGEIVEASSSPEEAMDALAERGDIRRALLHAFLAGDDDGSPESLVRRGNLFEQQGDWDQASECYLQALAAFEKAEDMLGQTLALSNLGDVARQRGQYDLAVTLYKRALQGAESQGDRMRTADLHASLAGTYVSLGEYDTASDLFNKASTEMEKVGDGRKLAALYNNMAVLYEQRRDHTRAEDLYNQVLGIYDQLGAEEEKAGVYNNLGGLYARQKSHRQAMEMFEKALNIQRRGGLEADMAATYNNIAVIHEGREDYPKALELYEKSLEIGRSLRADSHLAATYGNIGGLHAKRNDHGQAITNFQRSLEIAERIGEKDTIANGYFNLGQVYRQRGDKDQAIRCLKRAKDLFAQLGDKEHEAVTSLLLLTLGGIQ